MVVILMGSRNISSNAKLSPKKNYQLFVKKCVALTYHFEQLLGHNI